MTWRQPDLSVHVDGRVIGPVVIDPREHHGPPEDLIVGDLGAGVREPEDDREDA